MVLIAPGFTTPDLEVHEDSWEEIFFFGGDYVMPNRGVGYAGSVLNNPGGYEHGPFASQRTSFLIAHGLNPQPTEYRHLPGGVEAMHSYLNSETLLDRSLRTTEWSEWPQHAAVMDRVANAEKALRST